MKKSQLLGAVCAAIFILITTSANAAIISVEPDNFLDRTDISTAFPGVTLSVVGAEVDSGAFAPNVFSIVSSIATTGTNIFGNNFAPNFYSRGWFEVARTLRVDFDIATNFISIDMIGRFNDVGIVRAYNTSDLEVATYTTSPLTSLDTFEVASITRSSADISYLLIGGLADENGFHGVSLDNLNFATVPIPATLWLFGSGLLGLIGIAIKKAV